MKYKIGSISIEENGRWWVDWHGNHADQGGTSFRLGSAGTDGSVRTLLEVVSHDLERCKDIYLDEIKDKK